MSMDRQCWRVTFVSWRRGVGCGILIRDTYVHANVIRYYETLVSINIESMDPYFRIPVIRPRCLPSISALLSNSSRNPSSP